MGGGVGQKQVGGVGCGGANQGAGCKHRDKVVVWEAAVGMDAAQCMLR